MGGRGLAAWPSRQAGLLQDRIRPARPGHAASSPPRFAHVHLAPRGLQEQAFGVADLLFTPFPLEIPDLALVQVPQPLQPGLRGLRAGSCQ